MLPVIILFGRDLLTIKLIKLISISGFFFPKASKIKEKSKIMTHTAQERTKLMLIYCINEKKNIRSSDLFQAGPFLKYSELSSMVNIQ